MQPDLLWEEQPPLFTHLPLVVTPTLAQLERTIITTYNERATRLIAITGAVGVGKSTAGWSSMGRLGRSNRWGNCLYLVGDESMTPDQCLAHMSAHLHYAVPLIRTETPLTRFQHLATMRRPLFIVIDDADLVPRLTLEWLAGVCGTTRVVIGLIGQPALLTQLRGIAYSPWTYTAPSSALIVQQFLPQLSPYGWFLPRRSLGYARVAHLVAEAAQGSLRRLYQILFHARWLAALDGVPQMTSAQIVAVLDQRRGVREG